MLCPLRIAQRHVGLSKASWAGRRTSRDQEATATSDSSRLELTPRRWRRARADPANADERERFGFVVLGAMARGAPSWCPPRQAMRHHLGWDGGILRAKRASAREQMTNQFAEILSETLRLGVRDEVLSQ